MACAWCACTDRGGGVGIGALAFRPTPGCVTAVRTYDNGISPEHRAAPHSLRLRKGLGALRY